MFRKWITIVWACLVTAGVCGADRIAVAEPVGKGGVSAQEVETLWGMLESSVGGGYDVVSRAALKQILAEIGFAENSGLAGTDSPKQSARSGEIKTVKYILVSSVGKFGSRLNLSLSLVDASTGELVPDRKITDTADSLDEFSARLPGLLQEIGLAAAAKVRGIYAMLAPQITARNAPSYLADTFSSGMEKYLLDRKVRLRGLKTVAPILRRNGIAALDAAEPAQFARVGELLRVDDLIMPRITRFSVTEKREYIAASKRNVIRRICDFDGEIRILSAGTGETVAVIPFRQKLDFDDVEAEEDTDDWTPEDYGKFAIEKLVPAVGAEVVRSIQK